jgi:hypothetical protein
MYWTIALVKRYDERNSVENKAKTGRKKLVTERGDCVILHSVKVNRRETLRDLTKIELTWQAYLCTNLHDYFGFLMTLLNSSELGASCNHEILICGEQF